MAKSSTARRARVAATTASTQDYLAAIYDLAGSGKPVIGARLAKHMSISAPAVTEAMHRMARSGYVKVGPGKALSLTPKGREIAEVMARRHRLLERWLTDTLGLNWTDAHEEAHRLEHALSPRVEDRLAEMLGMPSTCPHGNPIPGMARPPRVEPFPLAQAKEGATVVVERITEEAEADKKLLEYLWRNEVLEQLRLGTDVQDGRNPDIEWFATLFPSRRLELELGDVLIRDPGLLHRGTVNHTDERRSMLTVCYFRQGQTHDYGQVDYNLDRELWQQLDPRVQALFAHAFPPSPPQAGFWQRLRLPWSRRWPA